VWSDPGSKGGSCHPTGRNCSGPTSLSLWRSLSPPSPAARQPSREHRRTRGVEGDMGDRAGTRRRVKKRHGAFAALFVLLALGLYFLPARRNYYGKLADLDVRLDIPYLPGGKNPKQAFDLYLPRDQRSPFPLIVF